MLTPDLLLAATAAPGTAPAIDPTAWLGQIAQTGLMGLLFCLVVYALIKRDRDLTNERAARLVDALAMRNLIEADTAAKSASLKLQEEHNRLMETIARNQEMIATRLDMGKKP